MCGIAGIVQRASPIDSTALVQSMCDIMAHRGPDDQGVWTSTDRGEDQATLGVRRLAILDLSPAGHMPMQSADGNLVIVYNGEVYNFPALRERLEAMGYRFRSHSDTEAILYLYQEYGPDCVHHLDGMFAIAIWDRPRRQLFLARDHFGIKPLYYHIAGQQFAFASEVKALLQAPGCRREMNPMALQQYLTFLWVPDPLTMFEGVYKVPAGHYLIWRDGKAEVTQYWDLPVPPAGHTFALDERRLVQELRERFQATVRSQMLSDVPIGAFLSAGLDSTSIVAAMAQASAQPVRTYTVAFPNKYRRGELTLDDPAVARRTAAHFGCRHSEYIVEPDVTELLPQLVWSMDEPTADPAIIAAYVINRAARKDVKVLLSGVGGDELFAGYRKYRAHYLAEIYHLLPQKLRDDLIRPAISALPPFRGSRLKGYVRLAQKMVRSGSLQGTERFIADSIYLSPTEQDALLLPDLAGQLRISDPRHVHQCHFDNVAGADFLNQMLYVDCKTFMVSLNLNYNDKMSMANSVEVRVPYLDRELAEWVMQNVPPRLKLRGGTNKYIFREAMRPLLPPEVLRQKKAGFGAPIDYWLTNDLRPMVEELLSEASVRRRGLLNPFAVRALVDDQYRQRRDRSMQIWQLLTLELWMRTFIDGAGVA